ncbi:MAG: hypothetical protein U9R57_14700 [Thermodesulfobacteriota bacterium]|nr:hypothetical protein [Thermodesulfobacteriota bacterium]
MNHHWWCISINPHLVTFNDKKNWNKNTLIHLKHWQSFWGKQSLEILDDEQVATAAEWVNGELVREIAKIDQLLSFTALYLIFWTHLLWQPNPFDREENSRLIIKERRENIV